MASNTVSTLCSILLLVMVSSFAGAQRPNAPPASPSPAPAPAPHSVNLEELLSLAGPFSTFLRYLQQTGVITTFQNQANNTDQGITIFVPTDAAFAALKKPSLSNLTKQQLTSLLLSHTLPRYYSLAEFKNLSVRNPVATLAGAGAYALNFTDASGLVRVDSGWADPKISSSVYATAPVAVYEVQRVLLPVAIFGAPPPPSPAPAPAPEPDATKPSDLAPSGSEGSGSASTRTSPSTVDSSGGRVNGVAMGCYVLAFSCGLVLLL